eukprot:2262328-Alexandrium_andersonii.AAC.1
MLRDPLRQPVARYPPEELGRVSPLARVATCGALDLTNLPHPKAILIGASNVSEELHGQLTLLLVEIRIRSPEVLQLRKPREKAVDARAHIETVVLALEAHGAGLRQTRNATD